MDKILTFEVSAEIAIEIEEIVKEFIAEMERAVARMRNDQAEIDQLKAETRAMLAQLKIAA